VTYLGQSKVSGLAVDGGTWTSDVQPVPAVDAAKKSILNSVVWKSRATVGVSQAVANGAYAVSLGLLENYQSHFRSFNVALNSTVVATGIGDLQFGEWREYGPYVAIVTKEKLEVSLIQVKGDPILAYLVIKPIHPPTLKINSRPSKIAPSGAVRITGKAQSEFKIDRVEFKLGSGKYLRARGTDRWSIKAKLKYGRNRLFVRVIDSNGFESDVTRIQIFRPRPVL
jgi:hypothetical protein